MNRDTHSIFESYQNIIIERADLDDIKTTGVGSIVRVDFKGNQYEFKVTKSEVDGTNVDLMGTAERDYPMLSVDETSAGTVTKGTPVTIIDTDNPKLSIFYINNIRGGMEESDATTFGNDWGNWLEITGKIEKGSEGDGTSGTSGEAPGEDKITPKPWRSPGAWAARKAAGLAGDILSKGDYGKGFGSGRDTAMKAAGALQKYSKSPKTVSTPGTRPEDDIIY